MPAVAIVSPAAAQYCPLPDTKVLAKALKRACEEPNEDDAGNDREADEDTRTDTLLVRVEESNNVDGVVRLGGRAAALKKPTAAAAPAAMLALVASATAAGGGVALPSALTGDEAITGAANVAAGSGGGGEDEEDVPMELSTEVDAPRGGPGGVANDDNEVEPESPGTSPTEAIPDAVAADGASKTTDGASKASASAAAAAVAADTEAAAAAAPVSAADAAAVAAAERWRQFWARVPPSRREPALRPEAPPPSTEQQQQQKLAFPPGFGVPDLPAPEPSAPPIRRRVDFDLRSAYEGGGQKLAQLSQILPTTTSAAATAADPEARPLAALSAPSGPPGATRKAPSAMEEELSTVASRSVAKMAMPGKGRASAASEQHATTHRPLGKARVAGERTAVLAGDTGAAAAAEPASAPSGQDGPEEETEEEEAGGGGVRPQGVSGSRGGRREETAGGRRAAAGPTATAKRQRIDNVSLRGAHAIRDIGFAGRRTSPWVQTGAGSEVKPSVVMVGSETGAGTVAGSETRAGAGSVGGGPRASPPPPQLLVGEAGEGEAVDLPQLQQQSLPSLPRRTLPAPWLLRDTSAGGGGGGGGCATAAGSSSERPPPLPALMGADMALLDQLLPAISTVNSAGGSVGGAAVGGAGIGAGEGGGGLLPRLLQGLSALQVRDEGGCILAHVPYYL